MKHALILLSALTIATPNLATAAQINLHTDSDGDCSLDLNHSTRVGPDFFEITREDDNQSLYYRLDTPQQLTINDQAVTLAEAQQKQLQVYHAGLYQSGRDMTQIAIDAVDIAMEGVGIALTTLAGADHPDAVEFRAEAEELRNATKQRLQSGDGIYVLGDNWEDENGEEIESTIEEIVERELEPRIERIATQSAGTIAWHALKAVFTGGKSIERDAEAAAEAAEATVEKQALQLEARAENMCHNLTVMDAIESDMQAAIPEMQAFDVIEVE